VGSRPLKIASGFRQIKYSQPLLQLQAAEDLTPELSPVLFFGAPNKKTGAAQGRPLEELFPDRF
jgi:hypothetical protein